MSFAGAVMGRIDPSEIVSSLPNSLLIISEELIVEFANQQFFDQFEVTAEETLGFPVAELGNGQWNIPALVSALSELVQEGNKIEALEIEHKFEAIGRRILSVHARKTARLVDGSRQILMIIEDVTQRRNIARELERQQRLSLGIVETLHEPLLVLDEDFVVLTASHSFYQDFQVNKRETVGRRLQELGNGEWAIDDLIESLTHVVPDNSTITDYEVETEFPTIGRKIFLVNARKIFREGNNSKTILIALEDITERRRLELEREEALGRANRLLDELNHRVMNSLAMIGSVISLEGRTLSDDECRAAFNRMRSRVGAIGTLYRTLTRANSIDAISADTYLSAIVQDIIASMGEGAASIKTQLEVAQILLSTRIAVPLGLIVNELVTNSVKHAFHDRQSGTIGLSLTANGDGVRIEIYDDGTGIDEAARVDSGLGQKLVSAFVQQLSATLQRESFAKGTRYILQLPHDDQTSARA